MQGAGCRVQVLKSANFNLVNSAGVFCDLEQVGDAVAKDPNDIVARAEDPGSFFFREGKLFINKEIAEFFMDVKRLEELVALLCILTDRNSTFWEALGISIEKNPEPEIDFQQNFRERMNHAIPVRSF